MDFVLLIIFYMVLRVVLPHLAKMFKNNLPDIIEYQLPSEPDQLQKVGEYGPELKVAVAPEQELATPACSAAGVKSGQEEDLSKKEMASQASKSTKLRQRVREGFIMAEILGKPRALNPYR
jgi:hypothetical protein